MNIINSSTPSSTLFPNFPSGIPTNTIQQPPVPQAKVSQNSKIYFTDIVDLSLDQRDLEQVREEILYGRPARKQPEDTDLFHIETLGSDFAPEELAKFRQQLLYPEQYDQKIKFKRELKAHVLEEAKEYIGDFPKTIDPEILEYSYFLLFSSRCALFDKKQYNEAITNDLKALRSAIQKCNDFLKKIESLSEDEVYTLTRAGEDIESLFSNKSYAYTPSTLLADYMATLTLCTPKDSRCGQGAKLRMEKLMEIQSFSPNTKKQKLILIQKKNQYYEEMAKFMRNSLKRNLSLPYGIRIVPQVYGLPSDLTSIQNNNNNNPNYLAFQLIEKAVITDNEIEKIESLSNQEAVELGLTGILEKYIQDASDRTLRIQDYTRKYKDYIAYNPIPLRQGERLFTLKNLTGQNVSFTIRIPENFEPTTDSNEKVSIYRPKGQKIDDKSSVITLLNETKRNANAHLFVKESVNQLNKYSLGSVLSMNHPIVAVWNGAQIVHAVYSYTVEGTQRLVSMYYVSNNDRLVGYEYTIALDEKHNILDKALIRLESFREKHVCFLD